MPLSGVRVIDLTRILAGPFCSMLLGDMGLKHLDLLGIVKRVTPRRSSGHFAARGPRASGANLTFRYPLEGRATDTPSPPRHR